MKTKKEGILTEKSFGDQKITRKAAIGRAGFMAISAATTMMLLSVPKAAHASAPAAPSTEPSGGTWTKRT